MPLLRFVVTRTNLTVLNPAAATFGVYVVGATSLFASVEFSGPGAFLSTGGGWTSAGVYLAGTVASVAALAVNASLSINATNSVAYAIGFAVSSPCRPRPATPKACTGRSLTSPAVAVRNCSVSVVGGTASVSAGWNFGGTVTGTGGTTASTVTVSSAGGWAVGLQLAGVVSTFASLEFSGPGRWTVSTAGGTRSATCIGLRATVADVGAFAVGGLSFFADAASTSGDAYGLYTVGVNVTSMTADMVAASVDAGPGYGSALHFDGALHAVDVLVSGCTFAAVAGGGGCSCNYHGGTVSVQTYCVIGNSRTADNGAGTVAAQGVYFGGAVAGRSPSAGIEVSRTDIAARSGGAWAAAVEFVASATGFATMTVSDCAWRASSGGPYSASSGGPYSAVALEMGGTVAAESLLLDNVSFAAVAPNNASFAVNFDSFFNVAEFTLRNATLASSTGGDHALTVHFAHGLRPHATVTIDGGSMSAAAGNNYASNSCSIATRQPLLESR